MKSFARLVAVVAMTMVTTVAATPSAAGCSPLGKIDIKTKGKCKITRACLMVGNDKNDWVAVEESDACAGQQVSSLMSEEDPQVSNVDVSEEETMEVEDSEDSSDKTGPQSTAEAIFAEARRGAGGVSNDPSGHSLSQDEHVAPFDIESEKTAEEITKLKDDFSKQGNTGMLAAESSNLFMRIRLALKRSQESGKVSVRHNL